MFPCISNQTFYCYCSAFLLGQERTESGVYTPINALNQKPGTTWTIFFAAVFKIPKTADHFKLKFEVELKLQSTLVISKSQGRSETLRDIRTSTYQIYRIEENTKRTTKFHK